MKFAVATGSALFLEISYERPEAHKCLVAARWFAIHFIAIKFRGSVVRKSEGSVSILIVHREREATW
jgi:hypothetical protein